MRPRVGIFGVFHSGDELEFPEFEFVPLGSVAELPHKDPAELKSIAADFDAIILGMFGKPTWEICKIALPMLGSRAKIGVWTLDSHNPGWADREREYAQVYDRFFTCSKCLVPEFGPKAVWMPNCYVWHGLRDLPTPSPDRLILFDFSCIAGYYLGTQRHRAMMAFSSFVAVSSRYRWMMGQASHNIVSQIYLASKAVVNCALDAGVPNMRSFESTASGAICLAWPDDLFADPMFAELRQGQIVFDPFNLTHEFLHSVVERFEKTPVLHGVVKARHMLIHRYAEMAKRLLE